MRNTTTTVILDTEHAKYLECIRNIDQVTQSAAIRSSIKAHFRARMDDPVFARAVADMWLGENPRALGDTNA